MNANHDAQDAMVSEYRQMQRREIELRCYLSVCATRLGAGFVVIEADDIKGAKPATIQKTPAGVTITANGLGS